MEPAVTAPVSTISRTNRLTFLCSVIREKKSLSLFSMFHESMLHSPCIYESAVHGFNLLAIWHTHASAVWSNHPECPFHFSSLDQSFGPEDQGLLYSLGGLVCNQFTWHPCPTRLPFLLMKYCFMSLPSVSYNDVSWTYTNDLQDPALKSLLFWITCLVTLYNFWQYISSKIFWLDRWNSYIHISLKNTFMHNIINNFVRF